MTIDPRFVASRKLFELCRRRVTEEDLPNYLALDPGAPRYFAAFQEILHEGEAGVVREFDLTEPIMLNQYHPATREKDPSRFRWFRLLCSATEVLMDDVEAPNYGIANMLRDSFDLHEDGDREAPLSLLSAVFREVAANPYRFELHDERAFFVLGELLLASVDRLTPAAIEALCEKLEEIDRRRHQWWLFEGGDRLDQPDSNEFVWSLSNFDQLHYAWVDLVEKHFPTDPPFAALMRELLLADGARWRKS